MRQPKRNFWCRQNRNVVYLLIDPVRRRYFLKQADRTNFQRDRLTGCLFGQLFRKVEGTRSGAGAIPIPSPSALIFLARDKTQVGQHRLTLPFHINLPFVIQWAVCVLDRNPERSVTILRQADLLRCVQLILTDLLMLELFVVGPSILVDPTIHSAYIVNIC